MHLETEIKTYLLISNEKFGIYLFDKNNHKNIYKKELKIENFNRDLDFEVLINFLDNNIFKIEKLIGNFVENIYLLIESKKILNLNIGIKKNYDQIISKAHLEQTITEAKDIYELNYQDQKILHILINKYIIDGEQFSFFEDGLNCKNLCLEIKIISIPKRYALEIDKVLQKYQIKIIRYLDNDYIKDFFQNSDFELPNMASNIINGCNNNEVEIIPKISKKEGFFEKFFQFFS